MRFGETLYSIHKNGDQYSFYVKAPKGYFHIIYRGEVVVLKADRRLIGNNKTRISAVQVPSNVMMEVQERSKWVFEDPNDAR